LFVDCWRFYPDSGVALQNWGKRSGYNCALLESFVGIRKNKADVWNDFVAIFVKDEKNSAKYISRIQNAPIQFANGRLHNSENIVNHIVPTQDQILHHKLTEIVNSRKSK
jgi:hypothetical protein